METPMKENPTPSEPVENPEETPSQEQLQVEVQEIPSSSNFNKALKKMQLIWKNKNN
jgi:hypothetical protein